MPDKQDLENLLDSLQKYPLETLKLVDLTLGRSGTTSDAVTFKVTKSDNRNQRYRFVVGANTPPVQGEAYVTFTAYNIHVQDIGSLNYPKVEQDHEFDVNAWNPGITFFPLPGYVANEARLMITTQITGCCLIFIPEGGSFKVAHIQPPKGTRGDLLQKRLKLKYTNAKFYGSENRDLGYGNIIGVLLHDGWNFFKQEHNGGLNGEYINERLDV
jgi:hypothetical protein